MSASDDQKTIVALRAALKQICDISEMTMNTGQQLVMSRAMSGIHSIARHGGAVLSDEDVKEIFAT